MIACSTESTILATDRRLIRCGALIASITSFTASTASAGRSRSAPNRSANPSRCFTESDGNFKGGQRLRNGAGNPSTLFAVMIHVIQDISKETRKYGHGHCTAVERSRNGKRPSDKSNRCPRSDSTVPAFSTSSTTMTGFATPLAMMDSKGFPGPADPQPRWDPVTENEADSAVASITDVGTIRCCANDRAQ